jgi:Sulfotransferase family
MQASRERSASIIPQTPYVRFIVLSGQRTGSHMLAQALNSHPRIVCFREAFNLRLDFVPFGVEGYDDHSSSDYTLRKQDPLRFLDERIFCEHPADIQAVGFKLHYAHHWDAPPTLERITNDRELRVVHLRRRNAVRSLVSLKLAETTDVWVQEDSQTISRKNLVRAARHPLKALNRVARSLRRRKLEQVPAAVRRVTIAPEECYEHLVKNAIITTSYEERFAAHETFDVFYEDLTDAFDETLRDVQEFLRVTPARLTVSMQRQNPEPLRDLVANYDELRNAFRSSEYAPMFDA